jgi:hypothetical protein
MSAERGRLERAAHVERAATMKRGWAARVERAVGVERARVERAVGVERAAHVDGGWCGR